MFNSKEQFRKRKILTIQNSLIKFQSKKESINVVNKMISPFGKRKIKKRKNIKNSDYHGTSLFLSITALSVGN